MMHYDVYLHKGYPIATGVVEGTCGSLVKDRMEQSGMRWSIDGAQAVLAQRAVMKMGTERTSLPTIGLQVIILSLCDLGHDLFLGA